MRKYRFIIWAFYLFLSIKGFTQCPAPTANISGTQSITQGQSATLAITLTGAAPWSITVNGQVYNNITSSPYQLSVSPASTTTYSISTLSNKCGNGTFSGSATVSVCITATAVITGTQTINQGQSANLSVALTGNSPWSVVFNGQTYSNITTSPKIISVSPNNNTTYTISSVSNPCGVGTKSGSAVVSVCHPATASITGTQTIPSGQSANLSVALTGDSPWSFTVNGQSYNNVSTSPKIISVSPTTNTTYTIANLSNACGAGMTSGSALVSVCSPATATLSGTQTITQGQNANLSVNLTGTSPWSFSLNGQVYSNVTVSPKIVSVNPTETTNYSLNSVSNSCGNGTVGGQALVTVYAAGCDPFENNDTPQKARLINSNAYTSLDHCFNTNADQDWYKWRVNDKTYFILFHSYNYASTSNYKFTLTYSNKTLTVTTMQSGANISDTYIELYDSDGQTQLTYNDDFGGTSFSQINYQIPDLPCSKYIKNTETTNLADTYKSSTYIESNSVLNQGELLFDAKNYIELNPGFSTTYQNVFTAKISGCNLTPPRSNGLVGYFPFDNGINDLSPYNHSASIVSGLANSTRINGNDAYQFIGDGYIKIPNHSSLQFSTELSISLWFNMANNASFNTLIAKSYDYPGFSIQLYETDGKLKIIFRNSKNGIGNNVNVEIPGSYQDNINHWKHLTVTINIPEINFFIDGTKIYTGNSSGIDFTDSNANAFIIGGGEFFFSGIPNPYNFWGFHGSIDEVRIYNVSLNQTEVNSIYNFEK